VIAQQLISYRQLSRLRKSVTAAGLSDATVSCVGCGPCNCSKADSDQNATGQEWYGLTEAADFQEVRYLVVKLQGLCLVQNSFLLLALTHYTGRQ